MTSGLGNTRAMPTRRTNSAAAASERTGLGKASSSSVVHGPLVVGVGARLQLQSRVLDVEVAGQALLQVVEDLCRGALGDAAVVDDDVSAQDGKARSDRPGVQVVDRQDFGQLQKMAPDL